MEQFSCNVNTSEKDQKYPGSSEMWCWRRMEISWTEYVENELDSHRVKNERNILHTVNSRKANWMDHILHRICILKHIIEGKVSIDEDEDESNYWMT